MGVLERFTDIIKSNINDLLDRCEDPAKMVDQYLRDLTQNLAEVKKETAGVMAEEVRTKRLANENTADSKKYEELAKRALTAGNEEDARIFLAKKQTVDAKQVSLEQTYTAAKENAAKMREMHDKLVSDIETLQARKASIKAKMAVAKTQEKVSKFSSADRGTSAVDAFDRMDQRADEMLNRANAMTELNEKPVDEAARLEKKYEGQGDQTAVNEEMERLKKELGL